MSTEQEWLSATVRREEAEVLARFAYQHRNLLDDQSYSRAVWFQLEALSTSEIDDYLRDLDELEDTVRRDMEHGNGCHLLLVLTGAGYRDMVFALRDDGADVERVSRNLIAKYPERLSARVLQEPRFGPYAALVSSVRTSI